MYFFCATLLCGLLLSVSGLDFHDSRFPSYPDFFCSFFSSGVMKCFDQFVKANRSNPNDTNNPNYDAGAGFVDAGAGFVDAGAGAGFVGSHAGAGFVGLGEPTSMNFTLVSDDMYNQMFSATSQGDQDSHYLGSCTYYNRSRIECVQPEFSCASQHSIPDGCARNSSQFERNYEDFKSMMFGEPVPSTVEFFCQFFSDRTKLCFKPVRTYTAHSDVDRANPFYDQASGLIGLSEGSRTPYTLFDVFYADELFGRSESSDSAPSQYLGSCFYYAKARWVCNAAMPPCATQHPLPDNCTVSRYGVTRDEVYKPFQDIAFPG